MNLSVRLLTAGRMLPQPWRFFSRAAEDLALQRIRKVLCVAEKNDAARGIAELLSNSRMRRVGGTPHRVLLPAGLAGWGGSVWCVAAPALSAQLGMNTSHQHLALFLSLNTRGYRNGFVLWTNTTRPNVFGSLRSLWFESSGNSAPSAQAAFPSH